MVGDREDDPALGGVVDYNLPAVVGFFKDEGEKSIGRAAILFGSVEVVPADADCEGITEGMGFEFREAKRSHGCAGGVVVLVVLEDMGVADRKASCRERV